MKLQLEERLELALVVAEANHMRTHPKASQVRAQPDWLWDEIPNRLGEPKDAAGSQSKGSEWKLFR